MQLRNVCGSLSFLVYRPLQFSFREASRENLRIFLSRRSPLLSHCDATCALPSQYLDSSLYDHEAWVRSLAFSRRHCLVFVKISVLAFPTPTRRKLKLQLQLLQPKTVLIYNFPLRGHGFACSSFNSLVCVSWPELHSSTYGEPLVLT